MICWSGRTPVGLAACFFTYSTFAARPTLDVEDLLVWPRHRGKGAGRNTSAIRFYERLGATVSREWLLTRLTGEPLRRLSST